MQVLLLCERKSVARIKSINSRKSFNDIQPAYEKIVACLLEVSIDHVITKQGFL